MSSHNAPTIKLNPSTVILPSVESHTRLEGLRLHLVRLFWLVFFVLCVLFTVLSLVPRMEQMREVVAAPKDRAHFQLATVDVPALESAGITLNAYALYIVLMETLLNVAMIISGVVIFWRKSNEWLPVIVSLALMAFGTGAMYNVEALAATSFWWTTALEMLYVVGYSGVVIFAMVFPDGKFVPPWMKYAGMAWVGIEVGSFFLSFTPLAFLGMYRWDAPLRYTLYVVITLVSVYSVFIRFRRLTGAQRQQVKWVLFGMMIAAVGITLSLSLVIITGNSSTGTTYLFVSIIRVPLYIFAVIGAAVALQIALLRYRLWDVDVLINRTLLGAAVTLILAAIFFSSIFAVQQLFIAFTGQEQPTLAVGAAMLVLGIVFNPLRRQLQSILDRRLYRVNLQKIQERTSGIEHPGKFSGFNIGVYQVESLIGEGGMGEVYRARHTLLNRPVAIKVLRGDKAREDDFRSRFEREAQIVAVLRHPGIVNVYDFGAVEMDGSKTPTYFMVMEHIQGQNLSDFILQNRQIPLEVTWTILNDVAAALDYAHGQGLVHRDVKPSNIMLQTVTTATSDTAHQPFRAVLMDFGIARMMTGSSSGMTQTGMLGTVDYAAPEQIRSAKLVDHRADIYSLGIVAFQMVTGRLPFIGDNPGAVVFGHIQESVPDPRSFAPDLPDITAFAIMRAMSKDRDDRFTGAGEFVTYLKPE